MERRYVLSLIVQNRVGVLNRISGLLTRRGFNIDSITAAETENPEISLIIVVFQADPPTAEQIKKQLDKQIDILELRELDAPESVTREHVMIKVKAKPDERGSIIAVAGIFRASVINVSPDTMIVELTGETNKTKAFIEAVEPYGIVQVARSGLIGMTRQGAPVLKDMFK